MRSRLGECFLQTLICRPESHVAARITKCATSDCTAGERLDTQTIRA